MKKIKTILITITAITVMTQSTFAADIPVESYPDNATEESVAIAQKSDRRNFRRGAKRTWLSACLVQGK